MFQFTRGHILEVNTVDGKDFAKVTIAGSADPIDGVLIVYPANTSSKPLFKLITEKQFLENCKRINNSLFSIEDCEKGLRKLQEAFREVHRRHPELNLALEARLKKSEQSLLSKFKKFLGIRYE